MGTPFDEEFDWAEGPGGDVPDEPLAVGSAGLGPRPTALPEADDMDDDPASFAFAEEPSMGFDERPDDSDDGAVVRDAAVADVLAVDPAGLVAVEDRLATIERGLERLAAAVEPIVGDQRILLQAVLELSRKVAATSEKSSAAEQQTRDIRDRLATFDADFRSLDRSLGDIRTVINGLVAGRSGGAKAAEKTSAADAKPIDMADLLGQ